MSTASPTFGELIGRLREEIDGRHLTQREAAQQIGVSPRTLQYWLEGKTPRAVHRRAIVSWLEATA